MEGASSSLSLWHPTGGKALITHSLGVKLMSQLVSARLREATELAYRELPYCMNVPTSSYLLCTLMRFPSRLQF